MHLLRLASSGAHAPSVFLHPPKVRKLSCRKCSNRTSALWLRPEPREPAYNMYRSREDIQESTTRMWLDIAEPERTAPVTVLSKLWYVLAFIKYHVIPLPIRYLFYAAACTVRRPLYRVHKATVLQLSRVDAVLGRVSKDRFRSSGGAECRFSRRIALQRFHGTRGVARDVVYWAKALVQGSL